MVKLQYGIKVPFDGVYIWVTHHVNTEKFDLKVLKYNTKKEAIAAAKIWGPNAIVEQLDIND